ncbi:L10-interacting MYB domain-containing protein-like [Lotus japonicus]|uniref:L10-interacting MYB domain-containing protein-like n=1 Tax=Lotus japonicus TaxID=34305 RepID=UPI00258DC6BE|nr:L10-interacting MYB domain-containing protein-like [Lotus japonicus]
MARIWNTSTNPTQQPRENLRWNDHEMDIALLHALSEEAARGNRSDGQWTTEAYANVVESLRSLTGPHITKDNVKNRMKSLKDRWKNAFDMFNGLSGFAWNPITRKFDAKEQVWEELIKANSNAAKFKDAQTL